MCRTAVAATWGEELIYLTRPQLDEDWELCLEQRRETEELLDLMHDTYNKQTSRCRGSVYDTSPRMSVWIQAMRVQGTIQNVVRVDKNGPRGPPRGPKSVLGGKWAQRAPPRGSVSKPVDFRMALFLLEK